MRQRSSSAIEQLRRRGRLFARDLRLGHIGAGRRWPPYLRPAAITLILALATLIRANLKVNYLQAETTLKRQQASDAVPAVFVTVAQGQTIIRYGDLVTPFQLEEAQAVGLLAPKADWARILAVLMLVLILFIVALGYLGQFRPAILRDPRQLATLGGLMLVLLLVAKLVVPINPNTQYLVPMAAVPLLVAALMDTGLGIIVALAVGF